MDNQGSRPFWHRAPKHEHKWTVVREDFMEPGGELGGFNIKGRGEVGYEALKRHYDTLDRMMYGATILVMVCECGERKTRTVLGDARLSATN